MNIDLILHRIKSFRSETGLNTSQWAELVGRGDTTFRKMMSDDWNPTAETIRDCEAVIPAEYMANANDDAPATAGEPNPSAACADRGDKQHKVA